MTVLSSLDGQAAAVVAFEEIDSTNAEARRRADAGEVGPLWVTAAVQTAGRGRRGRHWDTSAGNLAATLLMTMDRSPADAARTSFVAAVAVADMVSDFVPESLVRLKWPNDVLLDGAKVCGILIESGRIKDSSKLWLAIGIGVNLSHAPTDLERQATAVADHLSADCASPPEPMNALRRLAMAFAHRLNQWDRCGFQVIADAWTARAMGMGGPCSARLDNETVDGVAEGLDEDGALRMRLSDGTIRRISAGDVFFGKG